MDAFSSSPRVVILIPTYKARHRVVETFHRIPQEFQKRVIIIDDASPDDTYEQARTLPAHVLRNEKNKGYGGNMKGCLEKGLQTDGDVFIELHGDGQYDPTVISDVLRALKHTDGMLLGSRVMERGTALKNGMPFHKYVMNRVLSDIANAVLQAHITEYHSGFRVYTRRYLETVNFRANSNDHLFSFETLLQALYHGFTVSEIPVVCTYTPGVTHMKLRKGVKYVLEMLWALTRYVRSRFGWVDPIFQPQASPPL